MAVGDRGVVLQFFVNRLAADESKVVSSGQGGRAVLEVVSEDTRSFLRGGQVVRTLAPPLIKSDGC